ncbi:putative NDH-1 subunit M [delta proteobacterium NaphS2]|nr:putative NDH-1 subunit M [delta proteobacterium NaphS2]
MNTFPMLSAIVFLPLLGALFILILPDRPESGRRTSLAVTLVDLALVVLLLFSNSGTPSGQWLRVEDYAWIPALGIRYTLSLDGLSLMLLLLTTFLGVLSTLISWNQIKEKTRSYYFFLLLTLTGILGVFVATDLFLFYFFWEIQIIPMFFLVGIWGHEARRRTTIKFIIFTMTGSLFMLIALIGLYTVHGRQTGIYTFALSPLMETSLTLDIQGWLYAAFMLAFAIKIPMVPLHTWLPDTHTQAPTAGSVILAGLLLKTGVYGVFRFAAPLFPLAFRTSMPLLMVLGLAALFYASWIALSQTDIKRLIAYSSIGHMGLVVLGLAAFNSITLSGSLLQVINHGVSTSALFILVGILNERIDSREFKDFGGLWKQMPVFSAFFLFFSMASLGLPGLNNFVGEILILIGTYRAHPVFSAIGFAGLLFGVIYVLRMVQDALFGELRGAVSLLRDVNARETLILGTLALGVLFLGLYPRPVLHLFDGPIRLLMETVS